MINKINDPLANISINRFIEGFKQYPELEKVFNIRLKRLISKGISFYELPRIYQWIIINKYLMPKKLNTINSCLNKLFNIDNNNLNKKINEFAKWLNHQQIFNQLTEFLVISKMSEFIDLRKSNFEYEEFSGHNKPRFDINYNYRGERYRVDVTHKEDKYSLEDTAVILSINLEFLSPNIGGEIRFASPSTMFEPGKYTNSININDKEIREILIDSKKILIQGIQNRIQVPITSRFFEVEFDISKKSWSKSNSIGLSNAWGRPNSDIYFKSIQRKAEKSLKLKDSSYKIIALDFIPASDFHSWDLYRDQLIEMINKYDFIKNSRIDEIVTFSMRFENGEFQDLNLLWKKDGKNDSRFKEIFVSP